MSSISVTLRIMHDGNLIDSSSVSGRESTLFARFDSWVDMAPSLMGGDLPGTTVDMSRNDNGDILASHTFN